MKLGAAFAGAVLALSGCGSDSDSSGEKKGAGGFTAPDLEQLDKLGEPEGEVSVLAWPGYVEDGSNDPAVDWISDFEKDTGCQVNAKVYGTSDEAVNLMKSGEY